MEDGRKEGFLRNSNGADFVEISASQHLIRYLKDNPAYHIVQHGLHHDYLEFDRKSREEVAARLDRGARLLREAGFAQPQTFVAPYDRLSSVSLQEVSKRFRVLSTGWFELRRLPPAWWPQYAIKSARQAPHWRVGRTLLLSHPGCLLSYQRDYRTMLDGIIRHLDGQGLTVLVNHWWEYFRDGQADEAFISILHETFDYLLDQRDISLIAFDDLANGKVPFN
jgi:hypothetical protein